MVQKSLGSKIKYYRKKQNMTQSDLAGNIMSVSYLSKIENGKAKPTANHLDYICEKLELNSYMIKDNSAIKVIHQWFKAILEGNHEEIIQLFPNVEEETVISDPKLNNLIEIHKLQYYLYTNHEKKISHFTHLQSKQTEYQSTEKYYWLKFSGNYYYAEKSYTSALKQYREAEKYLASYFLNSQDEEHDLYYLISVTASKLNRHYIVIQYAEQALDFYRNYYKHRQAIKCHILLAISLSRIRETEEAKEQYEFALRNAKELQHTELLSVSYQNFGEFYANKKEFKKAITYFKEAYNYRKYAKNPPLVTIASLIKVYYDTGDKVRAKQWLKLGLEAERLQDNPIHTFRIKTYQYLVEGHFEKMEKLILQEVLPYLQEIELNYEKIHYLTILSKWKFDDGKYKAAAEHYREITEIYSGHS